MAGQHLPVARGRGRRHRLRCRHELHVGRLRLLDGLQPLLFAPRRRQQDEGNRFMTNTVSIDNLGKGKWKMKTVKGIEPWATKDPDTNRVWWRDGGVHQNITHAANPDPISGAHCWLQKVSISKPNHDEKYQVLESP